MICARRMPDLRAKRMADLAGRAFQHFGHHWWAGDLVAPQEQVVVGFKFGGSDMGIFWAF